MRLNFRLKGYVMFRANIYGPLGNGYSTTCPLEVFAQKLCSRLIGLKLNFIYKKKQKMLFEPFFGGIKG